MNESRQEALAQIQKTRHETMIQKVHTMQQTAKALEQAQKELAALPRYAFLKRKQAKQKVAQLRSKMVSTDNEIEQAHQTYLAARKALEEA